MTPPRAPSATSRPAAGGRGATRRTTPTRAAATRSTSRRGPHQGAVRHSERQRSVARARPSGAAGGRLNAPSRTRLGRPAIRLRIGLVLLAVVLSVYAVRLFELQAIDAPVYAADASDARTVSRELPALRGEITDRSGVVLAQSVDARDITADPSFIKDPSATVAALTPVLGLTENEQIELTARLSAGNRFAYVARAVTPAKWSEVQALDLAGIYGVDTTDRTYPAGKVGANVLGFVDGEGDGSGGVELGYDSALAGVAGSTTYQRDAQGREITTADSTVVAPQPGSTVQLTIDRDLQWYAQRALTKAVRTSGAASGTVVVMTPQGEILALAAAPTFNPNDPGAAANEDRGDRAVSDIYEPGSTSKVMTASAVIEEGGLTPRSHVVVPPVLHRVGREFHDHSPHGTWNLTLAGVVAKSSNIGTIEAAETIGKRKLYEYLKKFGIGDPSGAGLPGESRGILPRPEAWSSSQFYTIAFGQGLSLNAVQAASVYATIANGGVRVQPSVVSGMRAPDGTFTPEPAPTQTRVVSEKTASKVSRMLESVVSEEGTAPMAEIPGYRVAGKTGTANRVDDSCGCYRGYTASFIGYAPADDPALVVAVTLQDPKNGHYGGMLGGPVFTKVMSFGLSSLHVPPTGTRVKHYPLTFG